MGSRHLVDTELIPALQLFPPLHLSKDVLPKLREDLQAAAVSGATTEEYSSVLVDRMEFPGPAGAPPVPAMVYRPNRAYASAGLVLHIHGGGYIMGSPRMADAENRRVCTELGCAVVSVDYRLAPETPYPGAIEDCYSVLKYLCGNSGSIEGDRSRIVVSGDSAGGGLAAALCLLARDRGECHVAFQHLTYPMLDDRTCIRTDINPFCGEFVWSAENNRFGWSSLLPMPPGSEEVPQYASAARAKTLAGLPAAFIAIGALDLFLEENLDYAKRLVEGGVAVELHVYPGAFHGFRRVNNARVAQSAARDSLDALRQVLRPGV
jgi:acetyl esterase/lipase